MACASADRRDGITAVMWGQTSSATLHRNIVPFSMASRGASRRSPMRQRHIPWRNSRELRGGYSCKSCCCSCSCAVDGCTGQGGSREALEAQTITADLIAVDVPDEEAKIVAPAKNEALKPPARGEKWPT